MRTATTTDSPRQLGEPASLVIERLFEERGERPPSSLLARILGLSPLTDAEQSWYVGALGERRMACFLRRLPVTWTVVHSMPIGSGATDIDHIVIGPGGVFTINTKHHPDKSIWVAGSHVKVNGTDVPYIRAAETEARRLQALLAAHGVVVPVVRPIVAFVGAKQVTVKKAPTTVTVAEGYRLSRWLRERPTVLSTSDVDAISTLDIWPAGASNPTGASRFQQLHARVRRAALVRRAWALVVGLGILAASISLLPPVLARVLPQLFEALLPK